MGVGRPVLPSAFRSRTSEGTLSFGLEAAQPPSRSRTIRSLNPGAALPGSAIVLVHRADSSGSTFLFTSYMNAQDPTDWSSSLIGTTVAWPNQPGEIGAKGSSGIVSAVASAPGSIGYVGVSYLPAVTLSQAQIAEIKG